MASSSSSSSPASCNIIVLKKRNLTSLVSSSTLENPFVVNPKSLSLSSNSKLIQRSSRLTVCSVGKTTNAQQLELQFSTNLIPPTPNSGWSEFAGKVSGEWDGFGADFTTDGKPIELPESVVPEAYREWDVKVYDWQTQCPTLADPQNLVLSYRSIKLLPTVGCEADAATIYSTDEKNVRTTGSNVLAFAYQNTGCYVALWPVKENGAYKVLELEHCLIDPRDKESRVRVIQILHLEDMKLKLQRIRVFCEQWYGPFRNGDQLGGCAIRDSAFASTASLNVSDVTGVWQSQAALASYPGSLNNTFEELIGGSTQNIVRNEHDLIALPRQLWCSLKESGNGETCAEVGWLLDRGFSISSRCIFSIDGKLKEIAVGSDTC